MKIKDCAAIITGGVSGLGEAVARTLMEGGARVALLDLNRELGEEMAAALGDSAMFLQASADRSRLWERRASFPLTGSQIL